MTISCASWVRVSSSRRDRIVGVMAGETSAMTTAKALYQRWINELWTGKAAAAELVSDDFVGHWPTRDIHGPDELQAMVDETHQPLSELIFVVDIEPFVERDLVAARWIGTGATTNGP